MIKIIGVLFVFVASSSIGICLSESMRIKRERIITEQKMLREISELIRFGKYTMNEIAEKLYESHEYTNFDFIGILYRKTTETNEFPKAWKMSVEADSSLSRQEKEILYETGNILGVSDTEGQLSNLSVYLDRLKKTENEQNEKYRIKGKMYRSFGVICGAMIGILII